VNSIARKRDRRTSDVNDKSQALKQAIIGVLALARNPSALCMLHTGIASVGRELYPLTSDIRALPRDTPLRGDKIRLEECQQEARCILAYS
jgi:hypothetical protein